MISAQKNNTKWSLRSFRDPAGQVFANGERILRFVSPQTHGELRQFLDSPLAKNLVEAGSLVRTARAPLSPLANASTERGGAESLSDLDSTVVIEHEKIPFPSYPYEWCSSMLHAAGVLTIDLAESLLERGMGLKDATPYNILFRGPKPVFVDLLSFEQRQAGDPVWVAYAQFVRTILLPLLVNKYFSFSLNQLLLARRDGIEPDDVYKLCSTLQKLSPVMLELVSVPRWLSQRQNQDRAETYQPKTIANHDKARYILQSLFKRLRRQLNKLQPTERENSTWSEYGTRNNYSAAHFQGKESFITSILQQHQPNRVLDVGCNTGHFSVLAAQHGASVVAIDYDPVVLNRLWQRATQEQLDILPLTVDLTRPTPAMGWRNQECLSFLERAQSQFDCVFMLAVIHHMLVTERIPLPEILSMAAMLTRDLLVIEYVDPSDSMFRCLTRGREHLHADLTVASFEQSCRQQFDIIRKHHIAETNRWLYLLRKKADSEF